MPAQHPSNGDDPPQDGAAAAALADVRVVELAQVIAVPMCGTLLADLGADVIKVEPPEGDAYRLHQPTQVRGEGRGYTVFNRGKRSICIDLTLPASRPLVERLVRSADVVLVSFKASDLPRYGLDYERLRGLRPDLVYLQNTPYGPDGPFGSDGGYDVVVQGMSGLGAITGGAQGDAPRFVQPAYADVATGFLGALGVVTALRHRDRTGQGQKVETSLLATALTLGASLLHRFEGLDTERWPEVCAELEGLRAAGASFDAQQRRYFELVHGQRDGNIYFRHYRTRDGHVSVGSLSPGLYARLREALGLEDPRQQSGFDPDSETGRAALRAFVAAAEQRFAARTSAEWIALLRERGIPCGPFNLGHQVFDDPQIRANGYLTRIDHPALGAYETFAPPVRLGATPARVRSAPPVLDADADAVLRELAVPESEIQTLRAQGVLGRKRRRSRPPADRVPEGIATEAEPAS